MSLKRGRRWNRGAAHTRGGGRLVLVCTALGLVATACSSSGSTQSSSSGAQGRSSSSSSSASVDPSVAAAQQAVDVLLKPPTSLGMPGGPLTQLPKGKTAICVGVTNLASVKEACDAFTQAGKLVGINVTTISAGDGAPQDVLSAWNTILQRKPDVVDDIGLAPNTYRTQLNAYTAGGGVVIANAANEAGASLDSVPKGISFNFGDGRQFYNVGAAMAELAIAKSDGKADPIVYYTPLFPAVQAVRDGFASVWDKCGVCAKASYEVIQQTDIGTALPGKIVSDLRRDPKKNWVVAGFGEILTGVSQALKTAGLADKVSTVYQAGDTVNFADVKANPLAYGIPQSGGWIGWATADVAAHILTGAPPPGKLTGLDYIDPTQIFTQATAKTACLDNYGTVALPCDYQSQFKKRWGVS